LPLIAGAFAAGRSSSSEVRALRRPGDGDVRPTVSDALGAVAPAGLPTDMPAGGERMDLAHVVWVLLGHRDHLRRQSA